MKKYAIGGVLILAVFALFSAASAANAAKPTDYGLKEGDLISAIFSDDPDVYIINDLGYKRLFLNPEIFKFYTHLGGFVNVKLVTPEVRDAFSTSGLFRNCEDNDPKVYGIDIDGEDSGKLHWVNVSGDTAASEDPEFFNKVFCINKKEFKWYPRGAEFKAVKEVPKYERMAPQGSAREITIEQGNIKEIGKVVICHRPSESKELAQEITIASTALKEHLARGDTVGTTCSGTVPAPKPTCLVRPACLDATPQCLLSEPPGGWCQTPISVPAPNPSPITAPVTTSAALDNFAKCLTGKEAVMYGVSTCPYCQKQESLFSESFKYINYVECSNNSQFCQDKGIVGYPTWILPNGNKLSGVQDLVTLSKYTGCVLIQSAPAPTTPTNTQTPAVTPYSAAGTSTRKFRPIDPSRCPGTAETFCTIEPANIIKVSVYDEKGGFIDTRENNNSGMAGFLNLPYGNYTVVIDAAGFEYYKASFTVCATCEETTTIYLKKTSTSSTIPSITVLYPNGGEKWQKGSAQIIKWNSANVSSVYIKLRKGSDTYSGTEGVVSNIVSNAGFYQWTIPTTLPDGNDYAIRVVGGDMVTIDDSDARFNIATSVPIPTNTTP